MDKHFLSLALLDPASDLLVTQVDLLRQAIRLAQKRWPFEIDVAVVLPCVCHMIWAVPSGDQMTAMRYQLIRAVFARHAAKSAPIWEAGTRHRKLDGRGAYDLNRHLIVTAPVRAGLARRASDWPLSSFARAKDVFTARSEPLPRFHQAEVHQLL